MLRCIIQGARHTTREKRATEGKPMHPDQTTSLVLDRPVTRGRRLFDKAMAAFEQACEQRDADVAAYLLQAAETLLERPSPDPLLDRRENAERLVAARARLWLLQHPAPTGTELGREAATEMETDSDTWSIDGEPVLKMGHLSAGLSETSCVVLKLSDSGAEVRTAVPWAAPARLVLRLNDGSVHPARFRWARGLLLGLEFTGAAHRIQRDLRDTDLAETVGLLRSEQCFWDEALHRAVEDVAAAQARLERALRPYANTGKV